MSNVALRELIGHQGPFASVYLDFSHDTEDAEAQLELRRRAIRSGLLERGADQDTVDAMDTTIAEHEPAVGRAGLAVVGARGTVLLAETLRRPPLRQVIRYSELPYLLPLVELDRAAMAHVVVAVDRSGADFVAVDDTGAVVTTDPAAGADHLVREADGGGRSNRSTQNRVEEAVRQNIELVADEVARLATQVDARVVVVAGEVRIRSAVLAALPSPAKEIAVEVESGRRARGGEQEALADEIDGVIKRIRRSDRQAVVDQYHAERGRDTGRAVQGLVASAATLRAANAEVVLMSRPGVEQETVWSSPSDPVLVGMTDTELRDAGATDLAEHRADEAIPLAALAVGAELQVDDDLQLTDGIGVLRRHS